MNILFVNDIPFNPIAGGIERVTDILAKELGKRGYNIFYLCGKLNIDSSYLLNYDFPAKLYQLPEDGLFDNNINRQFYSELQKELEIDVVINQRGLDGWFNKILPFTTSKLISVIHSVPDCYVDQALQALAESAHPPYVKVKKFLKRLFPFFFRSYWGRIYKRELKSKYWKLSQYSNAIVTLSNRDIKIMYDYIPVECRNKILSIANPNSFEYSESSNFSKKYTALYVGRLTEFEKAPMRLLYIWRYLHSKYPEWQLTIVGDGPEKIRMQGYVKKHHLTNVCFEGQKKNVSDYYKEASFICLTSNFEGWGMALTEGMQYGCIPFSFNNYGAASEIIDDNINGCLIPPFNLKRYAEGLSELMNNETKRKNMSKAAIEKVKNFSAKNIANKWEDLFRAL